MSREIRNDLKTKKASIKLLIRAPFKLSAIFCQNVKREVGGGEEYFISILSKDM